MVQPGILRPDPAQPTPGAIANGVLTFHTRFNLGVNVDVLRGTELAHFPLSFEPEKQWAQALEGTKKLALERSAAIGLAQNGHGDLIAIELLTHDITEFMNSTEPKEIDWTKTMPLRRVSHLDSKLSGGGWNLSEIDPTNFPVSPTDRNGWLTGVFDEDGNLIPLGPGEWRDKLPKPPTN
jgi:hypothetical protein